MSKESQRTCPSCGNEFFGAMEFCPVCMFRKALSGGVESGESPSKDTVKGLNKMELRFPRQAFGVFQGILQVVAKLY
jgi:hypothetical protein